MEQGDWQNDADYPRAPLPAHERTWRHPSEVGAEQWVQSEPPLVVGRGLSVATGTVGAVLALGLLWLMVPHPGRGSGVTVETSATSVQTVAAATTGLDADGLVTAVAGDQPSTLAAPTITIAPSTTVDSAVVATTAAMGISPMPTMVLNGGTTVTESAPPIAVALMPGHYVVTTAAAVRGREGFAVMLPSGDTVIGAVVSVDVANGTAVLSVLADIGDAMMEPSPADISSGGSSYVVMAPEATTARLWVDEVGTRIGYDGDRAPHTGEGSVVLDENGRLVGLCTKSERGMQLVSVAHLIDALMSAAAMDTPAWLGVDYDLDGNGNVVVTRVLDDGPGRTAGIRVGDVIAAVDGVPINDLETLRLAINNHVAGDTVTLTVTPTATSTSTSTTPTSVSTTVVASTGAVSGTTTMTTVPVLATTTSTTPTTTVTATSGATTIDIIVTLAPPPDAP